MYNSSIVQFLKFFTRVQFDFKDITSSKFLEKSKSYLDIARSSLHVSPPLNILQQTQGPTSNHMYQVIYVHPYKLTNTGNQ